MTAGDAARFARELRGDLALVERVVRELPLPPERARVLIRTDRVSVDPALARALCLVSQGVKSHIELVEG